MNVKELLNLKDKVILVTGGSGKYGKCIVEGLAEADGIVIIASRNKNNVEQAAKAFHDRGYKVYAHTVAP